MGFSQPFTFLVKELSKDFCKAGFACNVQVSSLGPFNTRRSYSPSPSFTPMHVAPSSHHGSLRRNEPGGSRAAGDEWMERHAALPALGVVRSGSKPISATLRREMQEALKASGCCLLSGPWHQCSLQTLLHNSIKEAEGGVRKEDRKSVSDLLFTLRKTMRRAEGRIQPS